MKRRQFLQSAGAGLAAGTVAAPAIAQSNPEIRWRLTSGFPKSLDTLYGGAEHLARYVSEATDGKFQIQVFAPGEIVGTPQALDAIANGTVEMGLTSSYYYLGKDPTFALASSVPFAMNARQMNAWVYHGGAHDVFNQFYAKHNLYMLPGGNTGAQMGGWFRREVKSPADLKGLKFRVAGLAGDVLARMGVVPQQIPGGDIYPSLERGTIDAAEWVGPYDDEKLGFVKVAPFYYYPGFWEGGPMVHYFFNLEKWNSLPKAYKALLKTASDSSNIDMLAKYDARNPAALKRLVGGGAQLRAFSQEILDEAFKISNALYEEISAKNADFKAVYENMRAFRNEQYLWFQVAEYTYDNFMIRSRARG